jgi:hypothetical protein
VSDEVVRQRLRILADAGSSRDARLDAMEGFRNDVQSDWSRPASWASDDEVLDAITSAAREDEEDGFVLQSAAETLACLWLQRGELDRERFAQLAPAAKSEVEGYLAASSKLDWLDPRP